jgi:hypothetical protein
MIQQFLSKVPTSHWLWQRTEARVLPHWFFRKAIMAAQAQ